MKLITHHANLRYLTNFTGSKGFLLIGRNKNYFIADSRYIEYAKKLQKQKTRVKFEVSDTFDNIISKAKSIEFEADHMTFSQLKRWREKFGKKRFVPQKKTIEQLRLTKDENEISKLKKSQQINKKVLARIQKLLKPDVTELEIAWKIKVIGHELGAEDVSFEPIVAFGENSAIPHHQNTNRKLRKNDVILIDMGMKFEGYCSDLTRTFLPAKASSEQIAVYEKVAATQKAAISEIKAGVRVSHLDKIAKKTMGNMAEFFTHALGHGVGLEIHEAPRLSTKSREILKEDSVVTVEPGIYLPGKFGVRIEDMVHVKKRGFSIL